MKGLIINTSDISGGIVHKQLYRLRRVFSVEEIDSKIKSSKTWCYYNRSFPVIKRVMITGS
ncbi:MAG: hypothetical protein ABDH21_04830 [bacterium]